MKSPIVISLYDLTGNFVRPWAEAGYECWCVDIQHSIRRERVEGNIHFVWGDVRTWRPPEGRKIAFVACFSPCTHITVAGARDFETKGGYMLRDALEMFEAGRQVAAWSGAPYMCENPVGVLSSIPHIGKPDYYFHPWEYTAFALADNYTKKTCLWTGNGFVMPAPQIAAGLGKPDDRIHKCPPSDSRADIRSMTPMGFARAVFEANRTDKTLERAIKEAVRFAKESAQQEPVVPEWALRSQIEISNDLRTQLEDAQRRIVASQSLDEKAVAALSEFRAVMQNEAIPAIVETMRKRAEAGAKIGHLPLNMPAASNLGLAD